MKERIVEALDVVSESFLCVLAVLVLNILMIQISVWITLFAETVMVSLCFTWRWRR